MAANCRHCWIHRVAQVVCGVHQAANNARGEETLAAKERGMMLRAVETACLAAHKPVTLLLPAATLILALG